MPPMFDFLLAAIFYALMIGIGCLAIYWFLLFSVYAIDARYGRCSLSRTQLVIVHVPLLIGISVFWIWFLIQCVRSYLTIPMSQKIVIGLLTCWCIRWYVTPRQSRH